MIERIVPRSRPDDDALGSPIEQAEHEERLEKNAREQFDLRLRFAEAVSEKKGIQLSEAMRDFTDLHVRLTGKWPGQSKETNQRWQEFLDDISGETDHETLLSRITGFSKKSYYDSSEHETRRFWPFDYLYSEKDRAVDLHFGTIRPEAGDPNKPGVLSSERLSEMRQKLKEMFTHIKKEHPDAEIVRGASWLYNRQAYQRLYPSTYTANPQVRLGKFTGGGTWGQFRDKTGAVNADAQKFLEKLKDLNPDHLEDAFPNKTLMISAPISEFYKEYGVE